MDWQQLRADFLTSLTPNTRRSYKEALEQFDAAAAVEPDQVQAAHVVRFRGQLRASGKSEQTVHNRLVAVRSWYQWLMEPGADGHQVVQHNPAACVRAGRVPMFGRARKVSKEAFLRMMAIADPLMRAWLLFLALTGLRRAESSVLQAADVERRDGSWWYGFIGKGERERMWRKLPAVVGEAMAAASILPPRPGLRNIWGRAESTLAARLKKLAAAAAVDIAQIHVHGLRHLSAELQREDGKDVEAIRKFLRHRSAATTAIYLQALEDPPDDGADAIGRALLRGGSEFPPGEQGGSSGARAGPPGGPADGDAPAPPRTGEVEPEGR